MAMHINNEGIEPAYEYPWWTPEKVKKRLFQLIDKETDLVQGCLIMNLCKYVDLMRESIDSAYFLGSILHYAELISNNPMEDTNAEN